MCGDSRSERRSGDRSHAFNLPMACDTEPMPSVLPCCDPRDPDDPTYSPFYLGHPDDKTSFRAVDCASEQDVVLNRGRWEIWTGPDEQSEQEMWKESEETDGEEPVLPPASTSPPFPPAQTTTP